MSVDALCSVLLINEYIRMKYPDQYANFCANMMFNVIYYFSMAQLAINKHLLGYFSGFDKVEEIEFVLDGDVIYLTNNVNDDSDIPDIYDFVIFTDGSNMKKIADKYPVDIVCEEASFKFILTELHFADTILKIDFKQGEDNYYVVGNVFQTKFIRYLLKKHYDLYVLPDDYKLKILDQSVNSAEFDDAHLIEIGKDTYSTLSTLSTFEKSGAKPSNWGGLRGVSPVRGFTGALPPCGAKSID